MNAENEIKKQILIDVLKDNENLFSMPKDENIEDFWNQAQDYDYWDYIWDEMNSFRCSGEDTNLSPEYGSRHYECDQVARMLYNGKSVSWIYWYGGGKHGEPESIDWIEDAFFVSCEQVKTVKNIYTKIEE